MSVNLILETGAGITASNSYVAVAECDTYHEGHLYAEAWTGATADQKAAALIMATRTLDHTIEWFGLKASMAQSLDWPRERVPNPESRSLVALINDGSYLPANEIPQRLKEATCELARELLKADRTAEADEKGIKHLGLGQGAVDIDFDKTDRRDALTDYIKQIVSVFGRVRMFGMCVKLSRA